VAHYPRASDAFGSLRLSLDIRNPNVEDSVALVTRSDPDATADPCPILTARRIGIDAIATPIRRPSGESLRIKLLLVGWMEREGIASLAASGANQAGGFAARVGSHGAACLTVLLPLAMLAAFGNRPATVEASDHGGFSRWRVQTLSLVVVGVRDQMTFRCPVLHRAGCWRQLSVRTKCLVSATLFEAVFDVGDMRRCSVASYICLRMF